MAILKTENNPAKPLQQILTHSYSQLGDLLEKTEKNRHLNKIFRDTLDNELSAHCQIAKFGRSKMTLLVDNSAWATKLRYNLPDIIKLLNTQPEFHKLKTIRWQINTYTDDLQKKPPKRKDPAAQREAKALHEFAIKMKRE